ncbi:retrovirus-related Pol polyprotein from transposon 412 [Trichonephila clavipes]|uniref:RNA-directed DNA polymerase n=1 Tax=Trichonephila clavipes TaxID=2585209 RepID=A0A8X6V8Z1_TRICX|nr:retrovirus-related Pol polyprotein from transposon 412 [Trichonephila clavipes]
MGGRRSRRFNCTFYICPVYRKQPSKEFGVCLKSTDFMAGKVVFLRGLLSLIRVVELTGLNMPCTRQGEPPLAQPASEKINLIELIPMYDGSESLGTRRFLGKINDVAELGGWSNAEKGSSKSVQEFAARINKLGTQIFQSSNSVLTTAARNANDQLLQSRFISGLRNYIRRFVLARDPNTLEESINAALIKEQNLKLDEIAKTSAPVCRLYPQNHRGEIPVSRSSRIQPVNQRRVPFDDSALCDDYATPRSIEGRFPTVSQGNFREMGNVGGFRQNRGNENLNFPGEITPEGILIDKDKSVSINDFPVPTDQKQIESFLGCCNFYRRYIKNFAKRALPLTNLLRKNTPFEWTSESQEAFDDIKEAILNPPVLALPDPNAELQITTDASSRCIGAVLEQKYPNS